MDELFILTLRRPWSAILWYDLNYLRDFTVFPNRYIVRRIGNPIDRNQEDRWFQFQEDSKWIKIGAPEAFWRNWEDGVDSYRITIQEFKGAPIKVPARLM